MEHLSPVELVTTATAAGRTDDVRTDRHLSECRACSAELERLRAGLRMLRLDDRASEYPVASCLDEHEVAAFAEGGIAPAVRQQRIVHIADCSRCRAAVSSVRRALGSDGVATEVAALRQGLAARSRLRRYGLPIAVATCASIVLILQPDGTATHRERPVTAALAPQAISPVGAVDRVGPLRWSSVEGADRYRVTLFDAGGVVLHEEVLTDTMATLPPVLDVGGRYFWIVHARTGLDRWVASDLSEFFLRSEGRR